MKALVLLLTVVGVLVSIDRFSVCDDAHETACTPSCSCPCAPAPALHSQSMEVVEMQPVARHATPADTPRSGRIPTGDIFRPPIGA